MPSHRKRFDVMAFPSSTSAPDSFQTKAILCEFEAELLGKWRCEAPLRNEKSLK